MPPEANLTLTHYIVWAGKGFPDISEGRAKWVVGVSAGYLPTTGRLPFDPPLIHSQFEFEVFQYWDCPGWKEEYGIDMSCLVNFQSSFNILNASQTNRVLVLHCCPHDVLITITPILAKQSNHYVMLMARKSASAFRNEKAIPRVSTYSTRLKLKS